MIWATKRIAADWRSWWLMVVLCLCAGDAVRAQEAPARAPKQPAAAPQAATPGKVSPAAPEPGSKHAPPKQPLSPAQWRARRIVELEQQQTALNRAVSRIAALPADQPRVPADLANRFPLELSDATAVDAWVQRVAPELASATVAVEEGRSRLAAARASLTPDIRTLARWHKRNKRQPTLRIPTRVMQDGQAAAQRLRILELEQAVLELETKLLAQQRDYLVRSHPKRIDGQQLREPVSERAPVRERTRTKRSTAEQALKEAKAEHAAADKARRQALTRQGQAGTEAARLIAHQRALLEGTRAKQAALKQRLAAARQGLDQLGARFETFRRKVESKATQWTKKWPRTAPRFDELHDQIVGRLTPLQGRVRDDLARLFKGLPAAPQPAALDRRLKLLGPSHHGSVALLQKLRGELVRAAVNLQTAQRELLVDRLDTIRAEITWLDNRRIAVLQRATDDKRDGLTGLTRETLDQLRREIKQLVFDVLYWAYTRLHQVNRLPEFLLDIFTVGSMLWALIRLVLLVLLLRFCLRRWDGWLERVVYHVSRSVSLGPRGAFLVKLIDTLRHGGPALLVLIAGTIAYLIVGADTSPVEVRLAYGVFFWIMLYRLVMRVAESVAKYFGLQQAWEAEAGLHDEKQDGEAPATEQTPVHPTEKAPASTVAAPGSVLLVRSVRATARYLLVAVLILEIDLIAAGRGTIYGLDVRLFWWAAIPFAIYFLRLWRPYIVQAYDRLDETRRNKRFQDWVHKSQHRVGGILALGVAFLVVAGHRVSALLRRYVFSRDATQQLLAVLFRRHVARWAEQAGRVLDVRQELSEQLLRHYPTGPMDPDESPIRPPQLEALERAFTSWKEDKRDGSTALVGQAGMGKTTLVRLLVNEVECSALCADLSDKITSPAKVVSWLADVFGFTSKPSSEEELIRMIQRDSRDLVVIENCHNLFLRHVGGFQAYVAFLRIVTKTSDHVFWVITFNKAAWDYLHNVSGRVLYFERLIELPPWNEEQIRQLLLSRLARAAYRVSFSDLVVAQTHDVNWSAQLGWTSEGFFRLIWDIAGGNPRLATVFWLDSLVPEPNLQAVRVNLFREPLSSELEALPDKMAFVLTAVAEHENLSPEQAALATNLSVDFCAFAFRRCVEDGYLEPIVNTERYRLSVRWQQPILRFLKPKGFLQG